MENTTSSEIRPAATWTGAQAYILAVICLLLGAAAGYIVRGSAAVPPTAAAASVNDSAAPAMTPGMSQQQVTPEMLKHMAEKQAAPLLEQLKSDPNNPKLLAEVGNYYYDAQSFPDAIKYYKQSLAAKDDPNVRTDLGTAYFYSGDGDDAITEFQSVLKVDPGHANALFNLGMVKWQAKMDINGAIAAWEQVLKAHPDHPKKAEIEQLIARAKQHANIKPGAKTDKPANL